ncbi:hypothetical protein ACW95P_01610 [Candidatus Mycoplasma pogonae]
MENNKKNKWKYAAVAGGVLSLGVAGIVAASLLTTQNSEKTTNAIIKHYAHSSVVPISDQAVNFEISNLEPLQSETFYIKYWDANYPNPDPQLAKITRKNSETAVKFSLGNLNKRIVYNYSILDQDYNEISINGTFNTFNIPKINFISQKNSINFASETLNEEYYKNKIYLKYWEYREDGEAPEKTSWIAVIAEKNELDDNKQSYQFSGEINNLKENTPYVIQLSLNGKDGDIDFQSVVYTLGQASAAQLSLLNVSNSTANLNLSNLSSYIDLNKSSNNSIEYFIKYWKKSEPQNSRKAVINLTEQNSILKELTDLESATEYQAVFAFAKNNEETIVSSTIDFTTKLVPYVVEFTNSSNKHQVIVSNHNAAVRFSGFTSSTSNLDTTNMQLKLMSETGGQWKYNLATLSSNISTNVFSFESGLKYELNIVDTATGSQNFLTSNVQIQDVKFNADFKLVTKTDTSVKYEITDLPTFYKPEEMKLSLKPIGAGGEVLEADLTDVDLGAKKAFATIENLVAGTSYHVRLLPKYTELNSDRDDLSRYSLTDTTFKFEVPGNVTFVGVEGEFLNDVALKFKLNNLGTDFPTNESLKLQWRIKPLKDGVNWENPDETNSIEFNLASVPENNSYDVILNLVNNEKINFAINEVNEVRLVKASDTGTDLIKAGNKEFNLNSSITPILFNETYIPNQKTVSLTWQKPLISNVVASGLTGQNYGIVMERHFDGLTTQKQWQDFYGYLAFQGSESEVNNFVNHAVAAAQGYKTDSSANDYTNRNYMVPLNPVSGALTDFTVGTTDDEKSANLDTYFKNYNYNILLGSYAYDADFSVVPYNPSSFLSMLIYHYHETNNRREYVKYGNNKFQSWDSFPFTVFYKLSKYKQIGLAKDNLYLKNNFLTKSLAEIPAYTFANERRTRDFLSATTATPGWNASLVRKSASDTSDIVYVNDATGSVYAKMHFQNNENQYLSYYGWVKLEGFKVVDKTTPPTQDQWSVAPFPETVIGPYYLAKLFKNATDEAAKKAVIEKYFKITSDENIDFIPVSLEVDKTDSTKAILKVKLVKKGLENKDLYQVESTEFSYELTLNKLSGLPELDLLNTDFKGTNTLNEAEKAIWSVTKPLGAVFDINLTMAQLFYKIQEAKAQDEVNSNDEAVKTIKTAFKNKLSSSFTGFTNSMGYVYFRAKGERFISKTYADLTAYTTIIPEEKIGFFLKVAEDNTLTNDEDKLKLIDYLTENIDEMF